MIALSTILTWLIFAVGNIFLAKWHVSLRDTAINAGKKIAILHGLWAVAYIGISFLPMIPHWITAKWMCTLLGVSFALLHASIFPVYYNKYSGLSNFNLSRTSKSLFDRMEVMVGLKTSKLVNLTSFFLSIAALMFFIIKYPV